MAADVSSAITEDRHSTVWTADRRTRKNSSQRPHDHVLGCHREREELSEQIRALKMLKELAKIYGCDISKPANNVLEATQAVYFSYLAAVKEQNGAAMSLGRTSTFLDIYAERDLRREHSQRRRFRRSSTSLS